MGNTDPNAFDAIQGLCAVMGIAGLLVINAACVSELSAKCRIYCSLLITTAIFVLPWLIYGAYALCQLNANAINYVDRPPKVIPQEQQVIHAGKIEK